MKNYIEIYNLKDTSEGIKTERISDKRSLLRKFFFAGYSVNDLVNIAGSDSLGRYIYSVIFKNKVLSKSPMRNIRSQSGLLSWCNGMVNHLSNRAQEVHTIIDAYNNTQNCKLRITYLQDNFPDIQLSIKNLLQRSSTRLYKKYNIYVENIVEYIYAINSRIGLVQLIKLFLNKQYTQLNTEISILDFCEEMITQLIERDVVELTESQVEGFLEKLKNDMFSKNNIDLWIEDLNTWVSRLESFDLEFNINNREQSNLEKPMYRSVGVLSLGQKVVAMLSFLLSYSDYSQDFTPLIID